MTTTYLNNKEAAERIGCAPGTLRFWRHKGKGPKFYKFGPVHQSGVLYDPADIDAWLAERKFSSTAEYSDLARKSFHNTMRIGPSVIPGPWEKRTS